MDIKNGQKTRDTKYAKEKRDIKRVKENFNVFFTDCFYFLRKRKRQAV